MIYELNLDDKIEVGKIKKFLADNSDSDYMQSIEWNIIRNEKTKYFIYYVENEEIIWFVPISSKVDKYKTIYENKKKTRKKVYNFVFGKVLGKEKAFLIQNIFPTTEEFIESKYQNKMQDVEITETLKQKIIVTSMNVIKLAKKGINIPFYDITEMKNILLENQ